MTSVWADLKRVFMDVFRSLVSAIEVFMDVFRSLVSAVDGFSVPLEALISDAVRSVDDAISAGLGVANTIIGSAAEVATDDVGCAAEAPRRRGRRQEKIAGIKWRGSHSRAY